MQSVHCTKMPALLRRTASIPATLTFRHGKGVTYGFWHEDQSAYHVGAKSLAGHGLWYSISRIRWKVLPEAARYVRKYFSFAHFRELLDEDPPDD